MGKKQPTDVVKQTARSVSCMKRRIKRSSVNDLLSFEQAYGLLRVDRCPSDPGGCWVAEVPKEPPPVVLSFRHPPSLEVAVLRPHQVLGLVLPCVYQV